MTPAHDDRLPDWLAPLPTPPAHPPAQVTADDDDEYLAMRAAEIAAREDRVARHGLTSDAVRAELLRRGAVSVGGRATPRIAPAWSASITREQAREELRSRSWEPPPA